MSTAGKASGNSRAKASIVACPPPLSARSRKVDQARCLRSAVPTSLRTVASGSIAVVTSSTRRTRFGRRWSKLVQIAGVQHLGQVAHCCVATVIMHSRGGTQQPEVCQDHDSWTGTPCVRSLGRCPSTCPNDRQLAQRACDRLMTEQGLDRIARSLPPRDRRTLRWLATWVATPPAKSASSGSDSAALGLTRSSTRAVVSPSSGARVVLTMGSKASEATAAADAPLPPSPIVAGLCLLPASLVNPMTLPAPRCHRGVGGALRSSSRVGVAIPRNLGTRVSSRRPGTRSRTGQRR